MSDKIIPRWEWRTFGSDFGEAELLIQKSGEPRIRESEEIYILSANSGENTKIRFDLMDIKTLKATDDNGLEQWFPALKTGFPLQGEMLESVLSAWNIPIGNIDDDPYTLERLLSDLVEPHEALGAVTVSKNRQGFLIDDCIVELADLTFDGKGIRSVAVEMENPQKVWNLVTRLGLSEFENISYITALKQHAGLE
ncbi:MAG: hypothetical protein HQL50_05425 [Magnetococcales bacterium]|nr:hypothetical protein [Magnetococcales bacterium]